MTAAAPSLAGPRPLAVPDPQQIAARLLELIAGLAACGSVEAVAERVAAEVHALTGADGVSFILREGDLCHYLEEDAVSELWKGRRFPLEACISGWVMLNGEGVVLPDISSDPRIPQDAYRPTFVRSLVMAPVGRPQPFAAIGAYWAGRGATQEALGLLQHVADAAALALRNVQLLDQRRQAEDGLAALLDDCTAAARAGHLGAVEQLTAGVAHHFNNLLTVVAGCVDELEELPQAADAAQRLAEATRRGTALVQRMTDFARARPAERVALDLGAAALGLAGRAGGRFAPMLIEVSALPSAWAQVEAAAYETILLNLLANAHEAGARTVRVRVTAAAGGAAEGQVAPDGAWIVTEVDDDGPGLAEAVRAQAFLPFVSTRRGAAGLGLTVVEGLARRADGWVELHSGSTGARLRVILPRAAQRPLDVD